MHVHHVNRIKTESIKNFNMYRINPNHKFYFDIRIHSNEIDRIFFQNSAWLVRELEKNIEWCVHSMHCIRLHLHYLFTFLFGGLILSFGFAKFFLVYVSVCIKSTSFGKIVFIQHRWQRTKPTNNIIIKKSIGNAQNKFIKMTCSIYKNVWNNAYIKI